MAAVSKPGATIQIIVGRLPLTNGYARVGNSTGRNPAPVARAICMSGRRRMPPAPRSAPPADAELAYRAGLLRARAVARGAREEERRNSLRDTVAARRLIFARDVTAGETRVRNHRRHRRHRGDRDVRRWRRWNPGRVADAAGVVDRIIETAGAADAPDTADPGILGQGCRRRRQAGCQGHKTSAKIKNADLPIMDTLQRECTNKSRGLSFRFQRFAAPLPSEWSRSRCRPGLAPWRRSGKRRSARREK